MYRPRHIFRSEPRRGIILLIVLTMLTLFAVVGLSFVLYADAQIVAAANARDAQNQIRPDAESELLLNYFLSQLVYGRLDPNARGQDLSLAMNMWGPAIIPGGPPPTLVSYTYPDAHHMFLAAVKADGTVLVPSFVRAGTPLRAQSTDPRFPAQADSLGDVKNYDGGTGGNDSIWIDPGFPIMTAPDGRRYKPLFAVLIEDLDNRVNINVHGNISGSAANPHVSDMGYGPWEVSLQTIMNMNGGNDWPKLLTGQASSPQMAGRYGTDKKPGKAGTQVALGPRNHFYAQTDFDGRTPSGAPPLHFVKPPTGANCFPPPPPTGFPNGYDNGDAALEGTDHPLIYDYFSLKGGDYRFTVANMEALVRYGGTNSPALSSEIFRLCPQTFGTINITPAVRRIARLLTTHSFDIDRPINPTLKRLDLNRPLPQYPHQMLKPDGSFLYGPNIRFDDGGPIQSAFVQAQTARQQFADDIYRQFLAVAGLAAPANPAAPTDPELKPRRQLAQLAVNIVDFIDEDEISTPFNFYKKDKDANNDPTFISDPTDPRDSGEILWPRYWVFGTELPRVLLNEAMAEADDTRTTTATHTGDVELFVELHNPFPDTVPATVQQGDKLPAQLNMPAAGMGTVAYAPYRILVAQQVGPITAGTNNDNVLGNPTNVRTETNDGDFDPTKFDPLMAPTKLSLRLNGPPFPAPRRPQVTPGPGGIPTPYISSYKANSNPPAATPNDQGFFLVGPTQGPSAALATRDPFAAPNNTQIPDDAPVLRTPNLKYTANFIKDVATDERTTGVTVVLRRLANPHLPFNATRMSAGVPNPTFNPYVTIDYMEEVPLSQTRTAATVLKSQEKKQPYASDNNQVVSSNSATIGNKLDHSFGRVNARALANFDWLVHLDRQFVSPMELLEVSYYQPYQLTHQFSTGATGVKFQHFAPWFDSNQRLYMAFESLRTDTRASGVTRGGRIPGRININTIWDIETLLALCDPQRCNYFNAADVTNTFNQLQALRTPSGTPQATGDKPFHSLADSGFTINDTFLRSADPVDLIGAGPRLFQHFAPGTPPTDNDPTGHPYHKYEFLNKLCNNVTTRSNVFGVSLTVGFFEVDPTSGQLLSEIGRDENRHIRHRMFAIVDRTNLSLATAVTTLTAAVTPGTSTATLGAIQGVTPKPPAPGTVTTPPPIMPGAQWNIQPGAVLIIDSGTNQETVKVSAVTAPSTVTTSPPFLRAHAAGMPVTIASSVGQPPVFLSARSSVDTPGPVPVAVQIDAVPGKYSNADALTGNYDGFPWWIVPGSFLVVDTGPDQEIVQVTAINKSPPPGSLPTFTAVFTKAHANGFMITNNILGNPGPQADFNPRDPRFTPIVPYFSIID